MALPWLQRSREAGRRNFLAECVAGFLCFFRGLAFLASERRLWKFAYGPIIINSILFVGLILGLVWMSYHFLGGWIEAHLPEWLSVILAGLGALVAMLAGLLISFFLFTSVGNIVAAPFNEMLSEATEELAIGRKWETRSGVWQFVADCAFTIWEAIKLAALKGVILGMLLLLGLIPVVGAIPGFIGLMFFAAVDYLDLPMERKRFRLEEKRRLIYRNKARCLGFGAAAYLTLLIPFLQLLMLPGAVVGGTLLFLETRGK